MTTDAIQEKLRQAAATLKREGRVLVTGFLPQQWESVLRGLAQKVGRVVSYFGQPEIMDIMPQNGFSPVSSGGTAAFPLHTDLTFHSRPPKYIAMFCIDPGASGASTLSDGVAAYNGLEEQVRKDLREMRVSFPAPSHVAGGGYAGPCRFSGIRQYRDQI